MDVKDWWDPRGSLSSLHRINPLRAGYFLKILEKTIGGVRERRIIDIGCGGGLLSEEFARRGGRVTGIDLSPTAIECARRHAEGAGLHITYMVRSPGEFAKDHPEPFDCVVCCEVLEHVDGLEGFIEDACRLLKKDGVFLFSTINRTLKAGLLAIFVAEDILRMVPQGTHDYRRFIRPSVLVELLRHNSVEVEEIKGMSFDPLRWDFAISDDLSVNYLGYGIKR